MVLDGKEYEAMWVLLQQGFVCLFHLDGWCYYRLLFFLNDFEVGLLKVDVINRSVLWNVLFAESFEVELLRW